MKFVGRSDFQHQQPARIGVLLTNLGSPAAPTAKAVRPYLRQFLSDQRVVEIPRAIWWLILNGIILNTRPAKSAKLYQSIWTENGSPLIANTIAQCDAVQQQLQTQLGRDDILVSYAMRYGEPSIAGEVNALLAQGVEQLLVLPLYPQYAGSTTGSTFDALSETLRQQRWTPELQFINHYHDEPAYISACAGQIRQYWNEHGQPDKLLLSFHGLPKAHLLNGDPYFCQCQKTGRLIAEALELDEQRYQISFQSRFGKQEWLKPYTDKTLESFGQQGLGRVDVFCPGFSSDCLETLEEIAVENRDIFLNAGGRDYHYIAALNDQPAHIDALVGIIQRQLAPWLGSDPRDPAETSANYQRMDKG